MPDLTLPLPLGEGGGEGTLPLRAPRAAVAVTIRASELAPAITVAASTLWAAGFGYLAVVRHLAGGSHAEDLGFTDQVLWNFLHGQWFRTSIYTGAFWNTELDVSRLARPDSLLAFHFEPMLLLLMPLYAMGGAVALLALQAIAVAAGAIPAYQLGRCAGTPVAGMAVAAAYLMSPLGQWAVLSDFHTSTVAAPLLLLSVERLVVGRSPIQAVVAAGLAITAREDVAPAVVALGVALALRRDTRRIGTALAALGGAWAIVAVLVIRGYSGGISLFEVRYGATLGSGLAASIAALSRPGVRDWVATLLLSGGWLGVFAPLALLPALPSLALNALSNSPWMAAGKAHYSGLVLPFVVIGAATGLRRLGGRPQVFASATLVVTALASYVLEGAGPLAANFAPAVVTGHAQAAADLAASLPPEAAVSASTSLVPHVIRRPRAYVFPAINDADYVLLDLQATPAPTSAGDVYLGVHDLLDSGSWQVETANDGLLLLRRADGGPVPMPAVPAAPTVPPVPDDPTPPRLLDAALVPSPDGAIDVDGPRWILRTTWLTDHPLPPGTRLSFSVDLDGGQRLHVWDIAGLWWNPPDHWSPGQPETVDVPEVPVRRFKSWSAKWTTSP